MSMGDRIVVMKDGVVQQVDTPLNIYNNPVNQFVAGFIGSPTMNFMEGSIKRNGSLAFHQDESSFQLTLPSPLSKRVESRKINKVTLGIRPEHIYVNSPAEKTSMQRFTVQVEIVEPVGNEIFVYFSTGPTTRYVARIASDKTPRVGTSLDLFFDSSKLHLFDSETSDII